MVIVNQHILHPLNPIITKSPSWKENGQKLVDRWIKEHKFYKNVNSFLYLYLKISFQDALNEAKKSNAEIKPVNIFRSESSICLAKTTKTPRNSVFQINKSALKRNTKNSSIKSNSSSDDTILDNSYSASFFCINTLNSFGSNNDLESIRRDSLRIQSDKSYSRNSKRKHLFRVNSVDDAILK